MERFSSNKEIISAKQFANFGLDVGTYLLASGAHCGRLDTNIKRMAVRWGFNVELNPTFRGLLISVQNMRDESDTITLFRESPGHNVHLAILTEVSQLSWKVYDKCLAFDETVRAFEDIKNKKHYNCWIIAFAVGLACAGLCLLSKGDYYNAAVAWIGAFMGSVLRYKISKYKYNNMIAIGIAAFVTTLVTGLGAIYGIGTNTETAMATAVLYLIPGVPLINCVIDLIEGYLSSSINRALFAAFVLLCIAAGMTLCITLLGIDNFQIS
ncbi:threonine/serine exporter ThrE family protein [Dysgonomonas sp. 520]|uniref:threonine/serine ThrE exporter family protein n=1 Tax=Dysgonomonas sp. 520 TaxID=2302931 RepID=UPI0013D520BB|nr:threonine/serine exporter family protein [Dysgonomonas sp. 520]NDW10159.1 threonine/serine exporter [Dysgonomonas sp. 520]